MRKKLKIFIFSKMASAILIKFCGFIVHSKINNMTLSAFPEKIPETRKLYNWGKINNRERKGKKKKKENKELYYNLEVGRIKLVWCPHFYVSRYGNPSQHVETVVLLKAMGTHSMWVFIGPNMTVVGIYNSFPGELGLISEEDTPWKFGLINTTVQEQSAEVDSWHKILWMLCLYSLKVEQV